MDTTRRAVAVLGLAAALLLAGCGGAGPTTAPGGTSRPAATQSPADPGGGATQAPGAGGGASVDACSLLSDADIQAVLGKAVTSKEAQPEMGIYQNGCHWVLTDADAIVPPEIHLGVLAEGGLEYYKRYFEPFNDENGYTPIAGLGDIGIDADFGSIMVVKGDTLFDLQYLGGSLGSESGLGVDLARKVVANLGG